MAYTLQFFDAEKNEVKVIGKPLAGLDTAERQVAKRYGDRLDVGGLNTVTIVNEEGQIFRVYNLF